MNKKIKKPKDAKILYKCTKKGLTWTMYINDQYYVVECNTPDVTWGNKYPLFLTPRDVLQAESCLILGQIRTITRVNKGSLSFLKEALGYVNELVYEIKFENV